MVVMVIVVILATGVVFMIANPSARVKTHVFNLLGELNMARAEAVNRNVDVRVTFLKGAQDGYRVWVDDWNAGADAEGSDGVYAGSASGSDTLILETYFPEEVQFYDANATGGATKKPFDPWAAMSMTNGDSDDDGIEFDGADELVFTSMGVAEDRFSEALDNEGYVILYYPASATNHGTMRGKPFAVVVFPGVGRIRIARWVDAAAVPPWRSK